ncbi:putative secreted protein [Operophtera brumata]|uniref:Putative secreted protein n=1 Tax=Operophtera brumata TaxID=104452 RepID=A0A0L7L7P9_OPEBR|nr:putative secreted protein [Operophtera brumata]
MLQDYVLNVGTVAPTMTRSVLILSITVQCRLQTASKRKVSHTYPELDLACAGKSGRKVGIQGDERFCLMRTGTYNIFIEYCTCNSKDGCNASFTFTPAPLLLFTLAVITAGVKFLSY